MSEELDEETVALLTNENATFEEISSVLTSFGGSTKQLDKAIGLVLGVENVEMVLAEVQKVIKVTDDTDLEEEAKFDIDAFIAERGLLDTRGISGSDKKSEAQPELVPGLFLKI